MLLRSAFVACLLLSFSAARAGDNSQKFENSLNQVARLYQLYDCDNDFSADAAKNLADACKDAHDTPEVAATRGTMTCSFDLENYTVSAHTTVVSPEYHLAPNGDVKKIVKGDLSVTARQCKNMANEKTASSSHHPATEDLCYNYYPDKNFAQYQEKSECSSTSSDERKPANVTPSSSSPSGDDLDEDSDGSNVAVDVEVERDLVSYETAVR